jgi:hypothetical protein
MDLQTFLLHFDEVLAIFIIVLRNSANLAASSIIVVEEVWN